MIALSSGSNLPPQLRSSQSHFQSISAPEKRYLPHSSLSRLKGCPAFDCLGTVTGRILVRHPQVQQLRRSERKMIAPDPGRKLAYFDYAQFEPGVLASLSGDGPLLNSYNNSDIY